MSNSNAARAVQDDALVQEIAKRLMLAMLRTGAWRATLKNFEESKLLNERHGTKDEASATVRQCDHKALHEIYSLNAKAYNKHKEITLPSVHDGVRVVIAGKQFEHSDLMKEFAAQVGTKVEELVRAGCYVDGAEYRKQKKVLNGLFDERAWPKDADDLRSRFVLESTYLECPTGGAWSDWISESATAARKEVEEKVEKSLKHVFNRCLGNEGNGTGRLHQSVFDNLDQLLDTLNTLDVEGQFNKIVEKAKTSITKYTAEELRKDPKARADVARRADTLTDMFAGLRK